MSVAAWVKYDSANAAVSGLVLSTIRWTTFHASVRSILCLLITRVAIPYVSSGTINNQWHFLVATIDGSTCRFYVDGSLVGSVASPDVENLTTAYLSAGNWTYYRKQMARCNG